MRKYIMAGHNNDQWFRCPKSKGFSHPDSNSYGLRGLDDSEFPWYAPILDGDNEPTGEVWSVPVELYVTPAPEPPTTATPEEQRQSAYLMRSDPIRTRIINEYEYDIAMEKDVTLDLHPWLDEVAAIKAEIPL